MHERFFFPFRVPEKLVHSLHSVVKDPKSSPLLRALSGAVLRDNPFPDKDKEILPPYHKEHAPMIMNLSILQVIKTSDATSFLEGHLICHDFSILTLNLGI